MSAAGLQKIGYTALQPLTRLLPKKLGRPLRRRFRDLAVLPEADAVMISFPKSGRTWVRVMMSRMYHNHYRVPGDEIFEFDNLHKLDARIPKILITHDGEPWHTPDKLETDKSVYRGKKIILLARNPIDVAVSRYFHIRNRATWVPFPEYKEMPIGEFVWAPMGGIPTITQYLNIWERARATMKDMLVVRYEDFRNTPEPTLAQVARFLDLPASAEEIAEAVSYAAFENLRKKEEKGQIPNHRLGARDAANPDSLKVRKGKVRGYLDYFTQEEVDRMERYVRDHLSASYGYCREATE